MKLLLYVRRGSNPHFSNLVTRSKWMCGVAVYVVRVIRFGFLFAFLRKTNDYHDMKKSPPLINWHSAQFSAHLTPLLVKKKGFFRRSWFAWRLDIYRSKWVFYELTEHMPFCIVLFLTTKYYLVFCIRYVCKSSAVVR